MGIFDYVNYECICPVCYSKVNGFQSKSEDCMMRKLEPSRVANFYSSCEKCGCWIDFTANKITNFRRTVTGKDGKQIYEHTENVSI